MTAIDPRMHSRKERPAERPDLLIAEPDLWVQCSFPEMSTWDGAEVGEQTRRSHDGERIGASEGTPRWPGAMDSGSFILICYGANVGLQWALMKSPSSKHLVLVPLAQPAWALFLSLVPAPTWPQ